MQFKRDPDQQADHLALWSNPGDDFMAAISRQRGKSHWAATEDIEFHIRHPGSATAYVSKTLKSVFSIVEPRFKYVLRDCPDDIRPEFNAQRGMWLWPDGGETHLAGTDNKHYEKLRGRTFDFMIKDESGFFDDYEEVDAVLAPQLMTTGGIALEISTPPETAGHPFEARYRAAVGRGRAVHRTIYGHPRMTPLEIEHLIAKEAGKRGMSVEEFKRSTYFRREFLAEFVTEETRAAVPGWTMDRAKELVVAIERPQFFDAYVSLDLGFGDPHAALFGYWHYPLGKLVIEDEVVLRHANTEVLADAVKAKEAAIWGVSKWAGTLRGARDVVEFIPDYLKGILGDDPPGQPYLRFGDNDPLALADLHQKHGVSFIPTRKDEKHLQVDELDIMVRHGNVLVHPRCVNLVRQLYTTIWNKQRTQWERTGMDHGDGVDALVYMVRNLRRHKDPRPADYGMDKENQLRRRLRVVENPLAAAFGMGRKR